MKYSALIIILLTLIACSNRAEKNGVDEKVKTVNIDPLFIDSNDINGAGGQPFKEFNNCNFDNFIADNKTPKLAKDIYLDNYWDLNNDIEALALLDSLTAKNKISRPFYFKVVTKTFEKSDGYFSEELGIAGKEYLENNTKEFASNFDNKGCFTDKDLETWAEIVLLEIHLEQEDVEITKEEHIIYAYCRKLKKQSENYPAQQKETISKFTKILETKWGNFLKHV